MDFTAAATVVGATGGLELIKLVMRDVYNAAKEKVDSAIGSTGRIRPQRIYSKIAQVKNVRTLLHLDRPVDLRVFYHPLHITIAGKRIQPSRYSDLETSRNLIIRGVAGQGKSVFLRSICLNELDAGEHIPLFIELRYITEGRSFQNLLEEALLELGIQFSPSTFKSLCASGRLILLLDAFDEIHEASQPNVAKELDTLAAAHEQLPILITSRPDTDIFKSNRFDACDLSDLKGSEYQDVIRKLIGNHELSEPLIKQVASNQQELMAVLKTPLLVTLLVVTYRSFQEIPPYVSGFYDDLFQLLLQRHDGMKLKYKRRRACSLNDSEYRRAFEAFCFFSKSIRASVFKLSDVVAFSDRAITDCSFNVDAEAFILDISKITCLVLRDGNDFRFIHKSVQEYYAASFLRRSSDAIVSRFYETFSRSGFLSNPWSVELKFLSEIDEYRYSRFYILKSAEKIFSIQECNCSDFTESFIHEKIRGYLSSFKIFPNIRGGVYGSGFAFDTLDLGPFSELFVNSCLGGRLSRVFEGINFREKFSQINTDDFSHRFGMTFDEISAASTELGAVDQILKDFSKKVLSIIKKACELVKKSDDLNRFEDIFKTSAKPVLGRSVKRIIKGRVR